MKGEKDYEDFLELLNKNSVKYCIIGSFALAFHARPRCTKDMDIFIEPSKENADRVIHTLKEFGFMNLYGLIFLPSIAGCTFEEMWKNRVISRYGKVKTYFISKDKLIKNKTAAGRKQDLADLDILQ